MPTVLILIALSSIVACTADDAPQDLPTCSDSHCVSLACEDTDEGVLCTCGLKDDTYITCSAE